MDFMKDLTRTLRKFNPIWVIMHRLIKFVHFITMLTTYILEKLAQIYICEIVHLHRVPISIISDRATQFTSHFWRGIQ